MSFLISRDDPSSRNDWLLSLMSEQWNWATSKSMKLTVPPEGNQHSSFLVAFVWLAMNSLFHSSIFFLEKGGGSGCEWCFVMGKDGPSDSEGVLTALFTDLAIWESGWRLYEVTLCQWGNQVMI